MAASTPISASAQRDLDIVSEFMSPRSTGKRAILTDSQLRRLDDLYQYISEMFL